MAAKLNIGKTLLHKWISLRLIRTHSSAIKLALTDVNKLARLKFSLSQLLVESSGGSEINFQGMYNTIHIDGNGYI